MKKYTLLLITLVSSMLANGATFYVVEDGKGKKDGTSWANAFADVQSAINGASSVATDKEPAEVWIKAGTYNCGAIKMKNNVEIYGGFAGTEKSKDERVAGKNTTYLDGNGKVRVFNNSNIDATAKLDNVTIQNGYNSGNGAGMYNNSANPTITNCVFSGNKAGGGGAGMCNNNASNPTVTNCRFIGNVVNGTTSQGGGMSNLNSSSPVVTNCTFAENSATGSSNGQGGGMFNDDSTPVLKNCIFSGNTTSHEGGAVYNSASDAEFTNCTFSGNTAIYGGGMFNTSYSVPILTNCTFSTNTATGTAENGDGGGIYNVTSSPTLINCILWENNGYEIYNYQSDIAPIIDTCIIKNGKSGIYNSAYCTYKGSLITADPKLISLGNYGGPIQTIAVAEGSSAIEKGKVIEDVTTDARGVLRSAKPTIGAYEYNVSISITSNIPTVLEIAEGGSDIYTITVDLADDVEYLWEVDKNTGKWEKAGSTTNTLKVTAKANMDGWKYRCVVSNGFGSFVTSNVSTLDVLVKAKITKQPTVSAVAQGGTLELTAGATGDKLKYQWQVKSGKEWVDVDGATSEKLTVEGMTVNNAEYRCIVSNVGSTVTTKSVKVPVISKPEPTFDEKKHYPEAIVGKKATFAIKATKPKGETGTYKYQWYKKNANGSIEEISKATKATYTTPAYTQSQLDAFVYDAGKKAYFSKETYFCEVYVEVKKEKINWNNSESFKVMKVEEAKIAEDGHPEKQKIVAENAVATFTAKATLASGSKVVYQWQVCAFGLDENNPKNWKNTGKGQTLTIKKATMKLSGNKYRCLVSNDINKINKIDADISKSVELNVKGKPVVKTQPKAITSYEGLDLELVAWVYGYDLTYLWYISEDGKNWEVLDGSDSSLLLEDLDDTFFYRYVAYYENNLYVESKSAKVTVKEDVEVERLEVSQNKLALEVEDGIVVVQAGADVVIKVIATGDKPKYQWESTDDPTNKKSWEAIKGGTKNSYTIKKKNLLLESGKTFRCKVYNGTGKVGTETYVGTEDYSDEITIFVD